MEKRIVVVTKHNTRRNGLRTALYWSISEQLDDIEVVDAFGYLRDDVINLHWEHSKLPKWLKDVLETSAVDETGFSLKQSKFNIYFEAIGEDGDFQVGDIMKITKFL
jgi:hypothetical protein